MNVSSDIIIPPLFGACRCERHARLKYLPGIERIVSGLLNY
ncbi:hypothetical protein HMPREF3293_01307 [Christensenella minuta]|uniref:Uncharacterized protein n=1 Tax=Christensenella minuta TaxID=626937 RepID=A0A136Q5E2_9FIRM|nr:hypothetical protein HMPREF3293_01307 [Christensenella minuta]